MVSQSLMAAGAVLMFLLGFVHLLYTYFTSKLSPREPAMQVQMEHAKLVISGRTSLWRAWVGFNASHSTGAMFFGATFAYLALGQPTLVFASPFLLCSGAAMLVSYLILARLYWFRTPLLGIALAALLYLAGIISHWTS